MYVLQATGPHVIDDSRNLLYALHQAQLRHTHQGSVWLPTKLITLAGEHTIWLTSSRDLPDILYTGNFSFVASDRFMDVSRLHEHRGLEYWEVVLAGSVRCPLARYYLVNVYAHVDAVNLTAMSAEAASVEYPDPEFLLVPHRFYTHDPRKRPRWILDPVRVNCAPDVFVATRFEDVFLRDTLALRLRRARLKGVFLQKVTFRREPGAARRRFLASILAKCLAYKRRRELCDQLTIEHIARSLQVAPPRKLVAILRSLASVKSSHVETLSPGDMLDTTESMRAQHRLKWNRDLIVVAKDGRGGVWAVDTSSVEGVVFYIDHELMQTSGKLAFIRPAYALAAPNLQHWIDGLSRGDNGLPPAASRLSTHPRHTQKSLRLPPAHS